MEISIKRRVDGARRRAVKDFHTVQTEGGLQNAFIFAEHDVLTAPLWGDRPRGADGCRQCNYLRTKISRPKLRGRGQRRRALFLPPACAACPRSHGARPAAATRRPPLSSRRGPAAKTRFNSSVVVEDLCLQGRVPRAAPNRDRAVARRVALGVCQFLREPRPVRGLRDDARVDLRVNERRWAKRSALQ